MTYFYIFMIGTIVGGFCMILVLIDQRRRLRNQKIKNRNRRRQIKDALQSIKERRRQLDLETRAIIAEQEKFKLEFANKEKELNARIVSYDELKNENKLLKHDLQNIDVDLRKVQLDRDIQAKTQETISQRVAELGGRYLKENVKWISASLTSNNFVSCKERLQKTIERCRAINFEVSAEDEASLIADLKVEYEKVVRAAFEREEQARIKAQIREEQKLEREIAKELQQLDREREAIKVALEKALAEAKDKHSEEVERLKVRLAEAEEKSKRAMSQAQMTKSGYVYVISNIGSFGENVYKIGMTRRLEPHDRVRELSCASVPFPFDVHMMISCDDAPTLENSLHRALHKKRVNKVCPRKEFFKIGLDMIRDVVEKNHGHVDYVAAPEALEYRQSLAVTDEDSEFIESVYNALEDEEEVVADDV